MDADVEAAADELSAENEKAGAEVDDAAGAGRLPSNAAVNTSGSCSSSRMATVCGLILKSAEAEIEREREWETQTKLRERTQRVAFSNANCTAVACTYVVAGAEYAAAAAQDRETAEWRQNSEECADPPRGAHESTGFLRCELRKTGRAKIDKTQKDEKKKRQGVGKGETHRCKANMLLNARQQYAR